MATVHPTHNPANPAAAQPTPASILRAAAQYIDRHGWHHGAYYLDPCANNTPACAIGAIRVAVCGHRVILGDVLADDERYRIAGAEIMFADYLGFYPMNETRSPRVSILDWNDDDWRTGIDVTDAMRRAADDWDRVHNTDGAR